MADHAAKKDGLQGQLHPGLSNLLFDVWLVSRATTALIDEAIRASGLDADEFAVYSVLAANDRTTPTELARWMAAPTTTVSSYVKRFEKRGHVKRVSNPDDGRSYLLELTTAGKRAHKDAGELFLPVLDEVNDQVGSQATETQRRLLALHKVIESVSSESGNSGEP